MYRILHLTPGASSPSGISRYGERFRVALEDAGADVRTLPDVGSRTTPRAIRAWIDMAVRAAPTVDLVHAELGGGTLSEFAATRSILRTTPTPVFLTLHDPPRLVWRAHPLMLTSAMGTLRRGVSMARSPWTRSEEGAVLARATGIFVLTDLGRDRLNETHGRRDLPKVHVLPYPIAPLPRGARRAGDGFVLGYHGYWYRGKGLVTLGRALRLLHPAPGPVVAKLWGECLPSAGRSAERYRSRVLRVLPLEDGCVEIQLPGFLAEEQMGSELSSCDVIVLTHSSPRHKATLASTSASLWDARASGVPVIVSAVRGLAEHVRHDVDGLLVPPDDPHALAAALERLRNDPGLLARLGQGAEEVRSSLDPSCTGAVAMRAYTRHLSHASLGGGEGVAAWRPTANTSLDERASK